MLPATKLIESEALSLPVSERAELIVHLLNSLESNSTALCYVQSNSVRVVLGL